MVKGPKTPPPPDPKETAAAQTGTNVATAIANANLQNINQVTPDGSLTYDQTGTFNFRDPTSGAAYDIPRFTATQTLSPQQQAIKTQTDAAELNLAGTANDQSAFLKDYLGKPFDANAETEARLLDLQRKRLDPYLAERRQQSEQALSDKGIKLGSQAYDRGIGLVGQQENDAINQLILQGHGQAFQEAQAQRNQPINEITALLSGSQVSQPNFVPTSAPTIPTVDYAGLKQDQYNAQVAAANAKYGAKQSLLGGLFGLGSAFLGNPALKLSDDDAKKDKEKIGKVDDLNLYSFRYKGAGKKSPKQIGLMASEVERKNPNAVKRHKGLRYVDYGAALNLKDI